MDNNPNPEPNKALEDAANALNEAAVESEAPINEASSAEMDKLLNEEETPKAEAAPETPAEPAAEPAAPAVPETMADATPVVEAPAPVVPETPVTSETPAEPAAKPKGKKGLIIGCAIGVVAALGIGGFAFAYTMNNSDENVALSVISDLFSNRAKTVSGYFDLTPIEDDDIQTQTKDITNCIDDDSGLTNKCGSSSVVAYKNPLSHVRVDIKNDTNADNETSTSATFVVTFNDKDYKINVSSVVVKDYTLYVQISNLKDAISKAMAEITGGGASDLVSETAMYEAMINKVVGEIDGVWLKISIPDIVDSADYLDATSKTKIKDAYSCMVDVVNKASKDGGKYADIYKANAFVGLEKYTGSAKPSAAGDLYSVKLDANKFASFANAMTDQIDSYGIDSCLEKLNGVSGVSTTYTKSEVQAADYEDMFKTLNEKLVVSVENGFFSHKLSGVYYANDASGFHGVIDFKIEDLKGTVTAPADTKSISDVIKNVMQAYSVAEPVETSDDTSLMI